MPADRNEEQEVRPTTGQAPTGAEAADAVEAAKLPRPQITVTSLKPAIPQDGGEMELLVSIGVDFPEVSVDRKPLNLALVIDHSGSMNGTPLEAAKEAARTAVSMLMPGDWVSVVTFSHQVATPVPLVQVTHDRTPILHAISSIGTGGSTNLYGGWAEGLSQVMACPDADVLSRVILLSDGLANVGMTDPNAIAADLIGAVGHGVTTTSMGLGRQYDETLLRTLADSGNGNYVFIEDAAAIVPAFEQELAGISALRGRNVQLAAAAGSGLRLERSALATALTAQPAPAAGVALPDLVAGLPTEHLVTASFEPGALAIELELTWDDAITGGTESQRSRLELPALAREEFEALAPDPVVVAHREALRVAQLKERISQASRTGDVQGANDLVEDAKQLVAKWSPGPLRTQEESELELLSITIKRQDFAMAARQSEKFSRDRFRGQSDARRQAMFEEEHRIRQQKLASMQAARPQPAPSAESASAGTLLLERKAPTPQGGEVSLQVVLGDITQQHVDAIVSSTNRGLFSTMGVAGAISRRAGPEFENALRGLGQLDYGTAVFTPGFQLPASYIIHTATLPWGTTGRELPLLDQCYEAVFGLAERLGARSLALPAIGAGTYQYPVNTAASAAVRGALAWIRARGNLDLVRFVVFEHGTAEAYVEALRGG